MRLAGENRGFVMGVCQIARTKLSDSRLYAEATPTDHFTGRGV